MTRKELHKLLESFGYEWHRKEEAGPERMVEGIKGCEERRDNIEEVIWEVIKNSQHQSNGSTAGRSAFGRVS